MMKSTLILFAIVLFLGCSKDESPEKNGMSANIYGKTWQAETTEVLWQTKTINIVGKSADGSSVALSLNDTIEKEYVITRTTSLNQSSAAYTPKDSLTYSTAYNNLSEGTVTISEINRANKTISGSFSLTLHKANSSEVKITEGQFTNISYTKELPVFPDNSLSVSVSGSSWTPITITGMISLGKIVLNATNGSKTLSISVPSTINVDTYTVDSYMNYSVSYVDGSTYYNSTSGSIIISAHDKTNKRIEGRYNVTVANMLNASQTKNVVGSFAINY